MSKGYSGLLQAFKVVITEKRFKSGIVDIDVISERVKGLDLREHKLKYKPLSAKQRKEIADKIEKRTATRAEYKHYDWDRRFSERRKKGIINFWNEEQKRVLSGEKTTRSWNTEQLAAISRGERPKFNGKTIQGHHTYSAAHFPHLANNGSVIFPVTFEEHLYGWHGGNFSQSLPGKPIKQSTFHNFNRSTEE